MKDRSLASPEMNATPLIDVLLVLLVMLIFTLPVATHAVKLNLPQPKPAPPSALVMVHVDFDGQLFWNEETVAGLDALGRRFRSLAAAPGKFSPFSPLSSPGTKRSFGEPTGEQDDEGNPLPAVAVVVAVDGRGRGVSRTILGATHIGIPRHGAHSGNQWVGP
jgi:hypothetical protein